ncbi:MAG: hypothetical protein IPO99_18105 [Nitrospira sp.]|nr:hypothetical protein [Nitrospira sp.]
MVSFERKQVTPPKAQQEQIARVPPPGHRKISQSIAEHPLIGTRFNGSVWRRQYAGHLPSWKIAVGEPGALVSDAVFATTTPPPASTFLPARWL